MATPAVAGEIVSGEGFIINDARAAAQYGRADEITRLLDDGKLTPDAKDDDGCSLLQWAAINGRDNVVRLLLERGADCNPPTVSFPTRILRSCAWHAAQKTVG